MRAEQNLSIRSLALMVGLSKDYIVDIEHARKSPTLDTLVKLSAGFGVSLSELVEGIDAMELAQESKVIAAQNAKQSMRPPSFNYKSTHL